MDAGRHAQLVLVHGQGDGVRAGGRAQGARRVRPQQPEDLPGGAISGQEKGKKEAFPGVLPSGKELNLVLKELNNFV